MFRSVLVATALVLGTLAPISGASALDAVQGLGQTQLGGRNSRGVIRVFSCAGRDNRTVRGVQLRVAREAARIDLVAVQFGNGQWEELQVRSRFAAGSQSRWIDLRGGARCVRQIVIDGQSVGRRNRASLVRVYGQVQ